MSVSIDFHGNDVVIGYLVLIILGPIVGEDCFDHISLLLIVHDVISVDDGGHVLDVELPRVLLLLLQRVLLFFLLLRLGTHETATQVLETFLQDLSEQILHHDDSDNQCERTTPHLIYPRHCDILGEGLQLLHRKKLPEDL